MPRPRARLLALPVGLATLLCLAAVPETARAASFTFNTDPFAGSDALITPGRQIVGGESFITFDIASDVFLFDLSVFGMSDLSFASGEIGDIPASGANAIVLRTFDNDGNPGTAFNAGIAATLIANQITAPGAGFFVYFNSGLDVPRLVFSTDLSDPTADLKIMARLTNLGGQAGRDAFDQFSAANFQQVAVPEPASLLLMGSGAAWLVARRRRRA